jgi:hypothetical protein
MCCGRPLSASPSASGPLMQRSDRIRCTVGLNPAEPWLVGLSFGKFPAGGAGWLVRQDKPYDRNVRQPIATCNTCNMDGCAELRNRPCCTLPLPSSDVVCRNQPISIRLRCVVLLLGHRPPPVCLFVRCSESCCPFVRSCFRSDLALPFAFRLQVSRGAMKLWASNIDKCDEYSKKGLCDRKLCALPRTHPCCRHHCTHPC